MRVVRLNHIKFPPFAGEMERLAHYGIAPEPFEPAKEGVLPPAARAEVLLLM